MCLGVPGKVIEIFGEDGIRMGMVDFGGITAEGLSRVRARGRRRRLVVIHVGFAISVVDEDEAARSYALLAEMGNLEDIDLPQTPTGSARSTAGDRAR